MPSLGFFCKAGILSAVVHDDMDSRDYYVVGVVALGDLSRGTVSVELYPEHHLPST